MKVLGSSSCVQTIRVLMLLPVYGDVGQADDGGGQQQLCTQNTRVLILIPVYGDVGHADSGSGQQQLCTEHKGADSATCVWRCGPG